MLDIKMRVRVLGCRPDSRQLFKYTFFYFADIPSSWPSHLMQMAVSK